jgi:TonB family protein
MLGTSVGDWMKSLLATAFAAAAVLSSSGNAQSSGQAESWSPAWSAPYCTISTGDPKQLAFSIWEVPGSSGVEIYFIGDPAHVLGSASTGPDPHLDPLAQIAELTRNSEPFADMGNGTRVPVTPLGTETPSTGVQGFAMTNEDFVGHFQNSTELFVLAQRKWVGMRYGGAREAMSALQRCIDAKLKEWGIDPAALASLKRRPVLRLDSWVHYTDFPKDALADKRAGATVVRLTTDTAGRVTTCTVVQSSGVSALDDITCRRALKRAKYKPAIGVDGRPTAATFTNYVKFDVFQ